MADWGVRGGHVGYGENEMTQYEVGAYAYMRGDDFDDSRCADWQNGWLEYEAKAQQA